MKKTTSIMVLILIALLSSISIIYSTDYTPRTCSGYWGFTCGFTGTTPDGNNTMDGCSSHGKGGNSDEYVKNIYINGTVFNVGDTVSATCEYHPYGSGDEQYMRYYNGTGWLLLYSQTVTSSVANNQTINFIPNSTVGQHYVRCSIDWDGVSGDSCQGGGLDLYDNDDLPFNVTASSDTTPPLYSLNSTNSTLNGTEIKHSLYWTDNTALSGYIFSFDNGTGTFINDSWVAMIGTGNWSNVTKDVNITNNSLIRWFVWANDTLNNKNQSSIFTYNTTAASGNSCSCPSINTNWAVNMADYCVLSTTCNIGTGNLSYTGCGYLTINASVTVAKAKQPANCQGRYFGINGKLKRTG